MEIVGCNTLEQENQEAKVQDLLIAWGHYYIAGDRRTVGYANPKTDAKL